MQLPSRSLQLVQQTWVNACTLNAIELQLTAPTHSRSIEWWSRCLANCAFLTCTVCLCSYDVRSGRRIALTFEQAEVGQVKISPLLETLLAPALLPRGYVNQQLLLAIKEVSSLQASQAPKFKAGGCLNRLRAVCWSWPVLTGQRVSGGVPGAHSVLLLVGHRVCSQC